MEDTELEEGEACSYVNDEVYDAGTDPDIDFSYIEEKLQNVLGHFQKDFEGGVSAENLGAKFGGYGSFLPTYQRSPVWSHPRTHVQNHAASGSPSNLEFGQRGHMVSSIVCQSVRPGPASSSNTSLAVSKAASSKDSAKQKARPKSGHIETVASRHKLTKKKSCGMRDQKMLKFRIKVGSEDLLAGKNAAIYTGLGLDVSPSSSPGNSASDSEGNYCKRQNSPLESPTSILMVMTSLPVHRDSLLSPLSDDLIRLTDQEKFLKDKKCMRSSQPDHGSSQAAENGSGTEKDDTRMSKDKKVKSTSRKNCTTEMKKFVNGEERETDHLSCEELVKKTMELPLLSSSYIDATDAAKNISEVADASWDSMNDVVREKPFSKPRNNLLDSIASKEMDEKTSSLDGTSIHPKKDGRRKGGKSFNSMEKDANIKEKKAPDMQVTVSPKPKVGLDTKKEKHGTEVCKVKDCDLIGKKVLKDNKNCSILGTDDAFSLPGTKMSLHVDNDATRRGSEELKSRKDTRKAEDKYRDFFGDMVDSEEENQISSSEMKCSQKVEKRTSAFKSALKERSSNKRTERFLTEANKKAISNVAPPSLANRPAYNAGDPSSAAPVMIEDNWVCCDKCQKWRLLPVGMNPDNLPENWLCSMMSWLPGLNRCSVSQDETADALIAMYNLSSLQSQDSAFGNLGGTTSQVNLPDARHDEEGLHNFGSQIVSNPGNKKRTIKEITGAPVVESCTVKKSLPSKSRSSDSSAERKKYMQKEKSKIAEQLFLGGVGDAKNSKMKNKREGDQDIFGLPRKMKYERVQPTDGDWISEPGEVMRKERPSSSSGMHKDSESDEKNQMQDPRRNPKDDVLSALSHGDVVKTSNSDGMRKRKLKESYEFMDLAKSTGDADPEGRVSKKGLSENEHRIEKRAKISKSEGKESGVSRGSAKSNKKFGQKKKQRLGLESNVSQRSLDGMYCPKRDAGLVQLSAAANSSSSKISDSHKTKTSFLEAKGSPVESVSSSPMRMWEIDKIPTATGISSGKDEPRDAKFVATTNLSMFSEGEGGDRLKITKKERGKGSSSLSKDKSHNIVSDSPYRSQEHAHANEVKLDDGKNKLKEKYGASCDDDGSRYIDKKVPAGKLLTETSKTASQRNDNPDTKTDTDKSTKRIPPDNNDRAENSSEREKSASLPFSRGAKDEKLADCSREASKANGRISLADDRCQGDDGINSSKQIQRSDNQTGGRVNGSIHAVTIGHRVRGVDAPSPSKKESASQAANNALKEAKDLKHLADRLKNAGSNVESTEYYFQAALKFLHGASLLESCGIESAKHGEMVQSMQIYSSTAKLCGFCAHEFEKARDMAAAALAYKCMEVAYMRVVFSYHNSANRYRYELQTALPVIPPGESPSSSASDVDNLNHQTALDKVASSKGTCSPQIAGNQIISAQSRPTLMRLLNFTQDVHFAMDASRKSRVAFAAANGNFVEIQYREGISSIKEALDYSFQDVEGLLRLVRLAMEAINQ